MDTLNLSYSPYGHHHGLRCRDGDGVGDDGDGDGNEITTSSRRHGVVRWSWRRMCEHALRSALLMELASDQRMVRIRAELFCGAGQGARTSESPGAGPPHARNRGRGCRTASVAGFPAGCCVVALRY